MRYSYEFKRKCVELYYRGEYPDTPDGIILRRYLYYPKLIPINYLLSIINKSRKARHFAFFIFYQICEATSHLFPLISYLWKMAKEPVPLSTF